MTSGYFCDHCKKPFKGEPQLKIWGNGNYLDNEMLEVDGEFCEACAKEVIAALRKVMEIKK